MMKPEPSELVLRGCMPPFLSPPGPPLRFLKKSSKNSSNGEPGGSCGIAPRGLSLLSPPFLSPPLASTVCVVEILTTASITFSATSAIPSGPRAKAGAEKAATAVPRQTAVSSGRRRVRRAGVAMDMAETLLKESAISCRLRPNGAPAQAFAAAGCHPIRAVDCGGMRVRFPRPLLRGEP